MLRVCTLCVVTLFVASIPCFASPTQLNLNIDIQDGSVEAEVSPTGGSMDLQIFDSSGVILGDIAVTFSFGPLLSCQSNQTECTSCDDTSTSCLFGPGGSINLVVYNEFGVQSYTGTLLNADYSADLDENGFAENPIGDGTFTLNGFTGSGSFSAGHNDFHNELDEGRG